MGYIYTLLSFTHPTDNRYSDTRVRDCFIFIGRQNIFLSTNKPHSVDDAPYSDIAVVGTPAAILLIYLVSRTRG